MPYFIPQANNSVSLLKLSCIARTRKGPQGKVYNKCGCYSVQSSFKDQVTFSIFSCFWLNSMPSFFFSFFFKLNPRFTIVTYIVVIPIQDPWLLLEPEFNGFLVYMRI